LLLCWRMHCQVELWSLDWEEELYWFEMKQNMFKPF
jgi:hypothetical protein